MLTKNLAIDLGKHDVWENDVKYDTEIGNLMLVRVLIIILFLYILRLAYI